MNRKSILAGLVLAVMVASCAHMPDVTMNYYLPQTAISFKVVRTIACDSTQHLVDANTVTPSVTSFADVGKPQSVSLKRLRGPFSDSDAKFDFYDDGRLKAINTTVEGQGESIVKSTVTLLGTLGTLLSLQLENQPPKVDICAFIKANGDSKPLTLTYQGQVKIPSSGFGNLPGSCDPLPADTGSAHFAEVLSPTIGGICAQVEDVRPAKAPVNYQAAQGDTLLTLRQPARVRIRVNSGLAALPIWEDDLPVAQFGTEYVLPLPQAAAFGKETFVLALGESGALQSVQYTSKTGAAASANAANSVGVALQGETTAQKVADVKAEADLIAQQQRLVQCKADPKNCK